jgi:Uncharacterized protein conserved in bacteria (DUF2255)
LRSSRTAVRLPGLAADVAVDDVSDEDAGLAARVDAAYRATYGPAAGSMVTPEAVATTLRLVPLPG